MFHFSRAKLIYKHMAPASNNAGLKKWHSRQLQLHSGVSRLGLSGGLAFGGVEHHRPGDQHRHVKRARQASVMAGAAQQRGPAETVF